MLSTKVRGGPPFSSIQTPRALGSNTSSKAPAPAPTISRVASFAPAPLPLGGDGFGGSSSKAAKTQPPSIAAPPPRFPGGKDVSANFGKDPTGFAGANILNINNAQPPSTVKLPTLEQPFVPAKDSTVTVNVHQQQPGWGSKETKNANITLTPAQGSGPQAHYLHYLSSGNPQDKPNDLKGSFAGISGVPQHPKPGDPQMVVTGQLNGCAVHAFHDKDTQKMSFVHHADYSKNGPAELAQFQKKNPNLQLAGSITPQEYSLPTKETWKDGQAVPTGATIFANYSNTTKQWSMMAQLHEQKSNMYQEGRPDLVRPDFPNQAPGQQQRFVQKFITPLE